MSDSHDTIAALATPHGRGGLGIVRVSGTLAAELCERIFALGEPQPGRVRHTWFYDEQSGAALDEVLVTFFRAPHSYTAEDVLEVAGHGSPVLLRALLEAFLRHGARLAEPGEFSRRAFLNGRIDLSQAEAIRDLIDAQTLFQARTAALQLRGSVSRLLQPLQEQLRELIALLEAGIDFAEDDVSLPPWNEIGRRVELCRQMTRQWLESFQQTRYLRNGVVLAVVGRPNVGKSSLFNRLLRQERAIVTPHAGTTRDLISEAIDLEGVPVTLCDTAGVREAEHEVERLGVERSRQALADADIALAIFDASQALHADDLVLLELLRERPQVWAVLNKCDLPTRLDEAELRAALGKGSDFPLPRVSAQTGEGLESFRQQLRAALLPHEGEGSGWITSARHAGHLRLTDDLLARVASAAGEKLHHELLLVDLYAALKELGNITGQTTTEDILGLIFSTFCVGK